MLFILVADSLTRFLTGAASEMGLRVFLPTKAMQFSDDTVIITEAHPKTLKVIALVLKTYECLLGLKINRTKSAFIPIAVKQQMVQIISTILAAPEAELPLKYLGLPLTIRKPRKVHYMKMMQAVIGRKEEWQTNILSYGGRVTLVKSVISALPLHFMQALKLPK